MTQGRRSDAKGEPRKSVLDALETKPADPLLGLIGRFRDDPRPHKIDLGVGVYRNAEGATPVIRAVKAAERHLLEHQTSKSYLGPEGDARYVELLKPVVFGETLAKETRLVGVQTPGGTGALRLASDLIAASGTNARVWLGTPGWPNHEPIFAAAGLGVERYRTLDLETQQICFDGVERAIAAARAGDIVLLQACCNNPTGVDFDSAQWTRLAKRIAARGLLPLIDLAYQGFAHSLESDVAGLSTLLAHAGEALIAYSCSKNFALYRERTGALFAVAADRAAAARIFTNMLSAARATWSMPPDHGAAVVRVILESSELKGDWRKELDDMRARIASVRSELAAADELFAPLVEQNGMFSVLPLEPAEVAELQAKHAIYMAPSGRINVAGLKKGDVARFAAAVRDIRTRRARS